MNFHRLAEAHGPEAAEKLLLQQVRLLVLTLLLLLLLHESWVLYSAWTLWS